MVQESSSYELLHTKNIRKYCWFISWPLLTLHYFQNPWLQNAVSKDIFSSMNIIWSTTIPKKAVGVVTHGDLMQEVANKFLHNNSWAFSSTFNINQYDLLLYATIVTNQDERGMSMLICHNLRTKKGQHKETTIE
jgi:hypothetical protein